MAEQTPWKLSDDQRKNTVTRVAANIASLCFSRGHQISDSDAHRAAEQAEKKAYTVATVEANTTTGIRPHTETYEAYTRKLAGLVLEAVNQGGQEATPANHHDSTQATDRIDLTGERDFLTGETTEDALAAMLKPGSKIAQIKFSTKSFGTEAAAVAAKAIENVSESLTHADISDIIAGRPEKEVLGALEIISKSLAKAKLKLLDLSDNALGQKGILACAAAYKDQPALEELAVQNVGCSVNACKSLAELVQHAQSLRTLRLYNNMSDDDGAKSIAKILGRAPKLEYFRMGSSRVGADGGIALATSMMSGWTCMTPTTAMGGATNAVHAPLFAVRWNPVVTKRQRVVDHAVHFCNCLQRLDLSDNPMMSQVAESLAKMLQSQAHLQILNLNDTGLEDDGVCTIAAALQEAAPQLEELELALNEMTATGGKALAKALAGKTKLRRLNLRENELADPGAIALSHAVRGLPSLQSLDLTQNQLRRAGAVAITKAIVDKTSLESLELDDNEISEAAVDDIKAMLRNAGKAEVLGSMEDNDPDAADDDDEGREADEDSGQHNGQETNSMVDNLSSALQRTGLLGK